MGTTMQIIIPSHSPIQAYPEAPGLAVTLFIYRLLNDTDRNMDKWIITALINHIMP
jgi:hypothetical protein